MDHLAELVNAVHNSTLNRTLKWLPSPMIGGYITKLGRFRIEIIPPFDMIDGDVSQKVLLTLKETNKQVVPDARRAGPQEWRMIVYNSDGVVEFEIGEKAFQMQSDKEAVKKVLQDIYSEIKNEGVRREKNIVETLLNELNK